MPHVIAWDLETIPDISGFALANDLLGKLPDEVRGAMGDKFPKHIYHEIICIGALIARQENDHWVIDAVGAPHVGDRSESELITAFVDKIAELNPQLVTFNGSSFDLPVLRYRAMTHKVSAPGLAARPYFNRSMTRSTSATSFRPLRPMRRLLCTSSVVSWDLPANRRAWTAAKLKNITATAALRRSPNIARAMSSIRTAFGCAMNCFGVN